jgi:hypothetical protein
LAAYVDRHVRNFWGSLSNNQYWINNAGVAAAAVAFKGEIDEAKRSAWPSRTEANLRAVLSPLPADGAWSSGMLAEDAPKGKHGIKLR